ncbi:hypothetical protein [Streptomyces flaveolus]|uniref:hypothetical protein n=1 Tax=Streptomyces flaveolus TaxID=67297 RepID=UPI0033C8678F
MRDPGRGAVLARAALHGAIGREAAGRLTGTGHDGDTLLTAQLGTPAEPPGSTERAQWAPAGE